MATGKKPPHAAPTIKTKPRAAVSPRPERTRRGPARIQRRTTAELNRLVDSFLRPALIDPKSTTDAARALDRAEESLRAKVTSIGATAEERAVVEKRVAQVREAKRVADADRRSTLACLRIARLLDELAAMLELPNEVFEPAEWARPGLDALRAAITQARGDEAPVPVPWSTFYRRSPPVRDSVVLTLRAHHHVPANIAAMVTGRTDAALRKARRRQEERAPDAELDWEGEEVERCDRCGDINMNFGTVSGAWLCPPCYRELALEREPTRTRAKFKGRGTA